MRLAVLTSHPIQYYAPLFRELSRDLDIHVFFAHKASPAEQAAAGFGQAFDWDVDLLAGYAHTFLQNVAKRPGTGHFSGCDTPGVGAELRNGRFDALLVLGWHLKSFVQGIAAAKRLGLPVLVRGDSHLGTPRSHLKTMVKRLAYPPLLRVFDGALYVGRRSRAYMSTMVIPQAASPSRRIAWIPNGSRRGRRLRPGRKRGRGSGSAPTRKSCSLPANSCHSSGPWM